MHRTTDWSSLCAELPRLAVSISTVYCHERVSIVRGIARGASCAGYYGRPLETLPGDAGVSLIPQQAEVRPTTGPNDRRGRKPWLDVGSTGARRHHRADMEPYLIPLFSLTVLPF